MKKLAVVLAALLVLSCGTTFLAAPSPEAGDVLSPGAGDVLSPGTGDVVPSPGTGDVVPGPGTDDEDKNEVTKITGSAVDANGNVVEVTITPITDSAKIAAVQAVAEAKSAGSQVLAFIDVEVPAGVGKVTITFNVNGITKEDNGRIYLLHEYAAGKWEVIHPSKVVDGQITATFTSLSPVAIVRIADDATTLPKTGAPVVLPVVALVCAAGAVGCAKKVKFN